MVMPINQKYAAGAKAVPVLWRDYAWRVRVFVRSRREFLASGARTFSSAGGLSAHGQSNHTHPCLPVGVLRLVRNSGTRPFLSGLRQSMDLPVRTKLERPQTLRASANRRLLSDRCGQEGQRASVQSLSGRRSLQPKGCAPGFGAGLAANNGALNGPAKRLRPVLVFAASQLGALAPSGLRIYSVFEHPLPTGL